MKSSRRPCPPSGFSLEKPRLSTKSNHSPFHPLLLHEQHYTYNLNTKKRWNQKLINIEFDQEFKNYNFIIEWILKFKRFHNLFAQTLTYNPLYLRFRHQNIFKSKNGQHKSCLGFKIFNFTIAKFYKFKSFL